MATAVPQATWRRGHTWLALLIVLAILLIGIVLPRQIGHGKGADDAHHIVLWTWLAVMLLMLLFVLVVGDGITGLKRGAFVDDRNRMSLARVQLALWTTLILSAFLAASLAQIGWGKFDLDIGIPQELWLAMGISTASLVGSALILSTKKNDAPTDASLARTKTVLEAQGVNAASVQPQGKVLAYASPADSRWSDLFQGDEVANGAHLDLTKVQMFFFTVVLVVGYGAGLAGVFAHAAGTIGAFPDLDNSFVTLLALSHGGYLAKKAVTTEPSPPSRSSV